MIQLNKITLGLLVVIIQMLLYVNAGAIFPKEYVPKVQSIMLLYMIMTFAFSITTNYLPPEVHRPFVPELVSFFVFFFIFAGILYAIPIKTASHVFQINETLRIALPFMVLFAFVVAYTEELIFRGILPKFLTVIGSNILFGIFHWYAYQGDLYSILIAIIFGFIFSFMAERFGLMSAVGMHTAWNLRILGAF